MRFTYEQKQGQGSRDINFFGVVITFISQTRFPLLSHFTANTIVRVYAFSYLAVYSVGLVEKKNTNFVVRTVYTRRDDVNWTKT
jgi:hypothetical protein